MGNSLHNKIHLGRGSLMASKRIQAAVVIASFAGIGLVWFAIRLLK
jgi:hypothetical protein